MAIAFTAERASQTSASAATSTEIVAISSNCTAKACLVLHNAVGLSTTVTSVTDTKGNTWSVTSGSTVTMATVAVTKQDVGALTTSDTVTITYGANITTSRLTQIEEFSGVGVATADVTSASSTSAGTTADGGTATPSIISDMAVVSFAVSSTGACTRNATGTVGTYSGYGGAALTGTALQLFCCVNTACSTAAQKCAITTPVANTEGVMVLLKAAVSVSSADTGTSIDGISNLVPNPGFEVDTSSWATTGSFWTNADAVLTRITSDFDTGVASCQVVTDALNSQEGLWVNTLPTLLANTNYTFVARVKWVSGRPIRMGFRDASNAANVQTGYSSPTQWTTFKLTYTTGATPPATTSRLAIVTDTTAAVSTFLVDSVSCYVTGELEGTNISDATPETGTSAEASTVVVSVAETGTSTEANTLAVALPSAETGSGVESQNIGISSTDTGSGVESQKIAISSTDTGTSAEASTVVVSVAETGTSVETASIAISSADAGISSESASIKVSEVDTGTSSESASIAISSADTGTSLEDSTISISDLSADAGTSIENSSIIVPVSDMDSGSGAEDSTVNVVSTDYIGAIENSTVTTTLSDADLFSAMELGSFPIMDSDTGSALDVAQSIALKSSDTGSGSDTGSVTSIALSSSDTGVSSEASKIKLSSSDTAQSVESSTVHVATSSSDASPGDDEAASINFRIFSGDVVVSSESGKISLSSSDIAHAAESVKNILIYAVVSPSSADDAWPYWN